MTDESNKAREFIVPAEWQISGKKVTDQGDVLCVAKEDYDTLAARLREVEAERDIAQKAAIAHSTPNFINFEHLVKERDELRAELASQKKHYEKMYDEMNMKFIPVESCSACAPLWAENERLKSECDRHTDAFIARVDELKFEISKLKSGQSCAGCEPLRVENEFMKTNCISLLLHDSRMAELKSLATEMRDFLQQKTNSSGIVNEIDLELRYINRDRIIDKANLIIGGD